MQSLLVVNTGWVVVERPQSHRLPFLLLRNYRWLVLVVHHTITIILHLIINLASIECVDIISWCLEGLAPCEG